jgi:hypothetical protein
MAHQQYSMRRSLLAERVSRLSLPRNKRGRPPQPFEPVADLIEKYMRRDLERHALFEILRSTYGL